MSVNGPHNGNHVSAAGKINPAVSVAQARTAEGMSSIDPHRASNLLEKLTYGGKVVVAGLDLLSAIA